MSLTRCSVDFIEIDRMFSSLPSEVIHQVLVNLSEQELGCICFGSQQWKPEMKWILSNYFPSHTISQILEGKFEIDNKEDHSYYQYLDIELFKLVQHQRPNIFHLKNAIRYSNKVIIHHLMRDNYEQLVELLPTPELYMLCMTHPDYNRILRNHSFWANAALNFCQDEIEGGEMYIACDQYDKLESQFRPRTNTTPDADRKFWKDMNKLNDLSSENRIDDIIILRDHQYDDNDEVTLQSILYFFANLIIPRQIDHHDCIYINERNISRCDQPSDRFWTNSEIGVNYYGYVWGLQTMGEELLFVTGPKTKASLHFMIKDDVNSNLTNYGRDV
ncbi:MAG: hypothetical protein EOP45_13080, partial [Sphingobacteriaceae bacterium]